jgi:hypothetical protein
MNPPMRYKTKGLDSGSGFHKDPPRKKSKSPPKKKSPSPDKKPQVVKQQLRATPSPKRKPELSYISAPVPAQPQMTIDQLKQHIARAKNDVKGLFADTQELNVVYNTNLDSTR